MPTVREYRPLKPSVQAFLSENKRMVNALKKKGLDLDSIASLIRKQISAKKPYFDQGIKKTRSIADNANRSRALEMAIKIVDVLPSTKFEIEENKNINIHITMESAERSVKAANMEVIDIDAMEGEEVNEFLE